MSWWKSGVSAGHCTVDTGRSTRVSLETGGEMHHNSLVSHGSAMMRMQHDNVASAGCLREVGGR